MNLRSQLVEAGVFTDYDEGKTNSESQSMPWSKDDLPSELQAADGACRFLETSASLAGLGRA